MKVILILAMLCVSLAAGCGSDGEGDVAAAFYPLAFAAEQIAPAGASVGNLTPPGAEPHDLEVTPGDVQRVRSARLVLLLGRGFQPQLEEAAGRGENVLRLLDTPGLRLSPAGDPHVWLDPLRFAVIVRRIGEALDRPVEAAALSARLAELHDQYRRGLAQCARRDLVTSHEAFGYLADRYGLRQVGITGLSPEAEPTPQALHRAVEVVRRTHATTVFFETLVSPRIAQTVAREAGVATAVLDPIEGLSEEETARGGDYFSVMLSNLEHLRGALGCR